MKTPPLSACASSRRTTFFLKRSALAGIASLVILPFFGSLQAEEPAPNIPGLMVVEYPRRDAQTDENHFALPLKEFGEPTRRKYVAESLSPWRWNPDRNALAMGYLKIETDGEYQFSTRSFYDRNVLMVDNQEVCGFRDGEEKVATIALKKGAVKLVSVGFVGGRGNEGVQIRWRPPGQVELSAIPQHLLFHLDASTRLRPCPVTIAPIDEPSPQDAPALTPIVGPSGRLADHLITVTDDFVIEAYKNGRVIKARNLVAEIYGATVERIDVQVRPGDWIVFHVANNRLRWGGVKYFAVAGIFGKNQFGLVSDPNSTDWSVCDDPGRAREFIRNRDEGTDIRASVIANPWAEGDDHMRAHAGADFPGRPLWGGGSSTWIKYVAPAGPTKFPTYSVTSPEKDPALTPEVRSEPKPAKKPVADAESKSTVTPPPVPAVPKAVASPARWPVQVISAIYGTGGKNADVTARVKDLVENQRAFFAVDPPNLGADPNPYWNKGLTIVYMKDGVRREQHRGENEHVLPESFYGPQDAAELTKWLPGSRWRGEKGELQFHADRTVTGPGIDGAPTWETLANNHFRITWAADRKVEYYFDYTWSSLREAADAKVVYHGVK